jgi:hypothetical protein
MNKPNWSPDKIAKSCTCYVSYIVERSDYQRLGTLNDIIVNDGVRECF